MTAPWLGTSTSAEPDQQYTSWLDGVRLTGISTNKHIKAALYTIVPRSLFITFCTRHLQLLSRAAAVMAEMEISPQEEIANPQGMKVFTVERHELPEDFASFPALCGVPSSPLVFVPNRPVSGVRYIQW